MFERAGGAETDIVDEDAARHTAGCNDLELQFMNPIDSGQHHAGRNPLGAGVITQLNRSGQSFTSYPDFKEVIFTATWWRGHEVLKTNSDRIGLGQRKRLSNALGSRYSEPTQPRHPFFMTIAKRTPLELFTLKDDLACWGLRPCLIGLKTTIA